MSSLFPEKERETERSKREAKKFSDDDGRGETESRRGT